VNGHLLIFREVAMIFAGAFLGGAIAHRLRQPVIIGYVLAGLALSPFTPGPSVHDVHSFEMMAEVGVILLMFSVGVEFSVPDLLSVKWVALLGAPLGIGLFAALGMGVAWILRWPPTQGLAIGFMICVASTMVVLRLLMERGELLTPSGRVMMGITLMEDLAVVILTIVLPALSSFEPSKLLAVAWEIGKAFLILAPILLAAWKVVPKLLARINRIGSMELTLLFALTVCLATAAVTEAVGLSLALGAFLAGLLVGSSELAHTTVQSTLSLRDAFVALFFVTVGLLINPRALAQDWPLLLLMVGLVLVGKFVIWASVVRLFRYSWETSWRTAMGLTQIGEFSFILAQTSRQAGLITPELYNVVLAASLVTILVNAALFRAFGGAGAKATLLSAAQVVSGS
jgi:CPA2 family monovalent cation:H+ antiporter-2